LATPAFRSRVKRVVGILLVVILFTGGANLHYVSQGMVMATGEGVAHHAKYLMVFFIKLFLVLGVLTIFLYTIIFKNDPTGHEDQEELDEMAVEPVPFQRVALWMGVFIILCRISAGRRSVFPLLSTRIQIDLIPQKRATQIRKRACFSRLGKPTKCGLRK
jgi:hypothetical protein